MQDGVLSHPDLQNTNRIILGPDYSWDQLSYPKDELGHGTHTTGITAAETNNGIGIAGIAGNCKIMVVKVFNKNGRGSDSSFYYGVMYAVNYIINNPGNKLVINYSGGGPASVLVASAVSYANANNVSIIASAGNDNGGTVKYPAAYSSTYSNVIAVSATDQNDIVASYSNVGSQINISAPGGFGGYLSGGVFYYNGTGNSGKNIYSTEPNYPYNIKNGTDATLNYSYLCGTSMAAPQVTGTVGLMLSMNPAMTPAQIRQILQATAVKVSGMNGQNFTNQYGYGRLNANQAVLWSMAMLNQSANDNGTGDNHNRTIAIGNYLYEAFSSGGEIFVRQTSNNGTTWNYTNRVSAGNLNNTQPSIVVFTKTGTTDTVNIVWQRSLGNNYYDIYYSVSGNSGSTWSAPFKIASNVLTSNNQSCGPLPVIAGISKQDGISQIESVAMRPMTPAIYLNGVLVVYASNSGLLYQCNYLKNGPTFWSYPYSIQTSQPGSNIWQPSLSSKAFSGYNSAHLSYDARFAHKIYSKSYDPETDTWSSEATVYDGTGANSYDRLSCIAAYLNLYAAWMSYNSNTGYYTVKFRQGTFPNSWGSWVWTYAGTTGNCYYPSVTSYYNSGVEKVAITEFILPSALIYLHKADVVNQTFTTSNIGTNAKFANLPNLNYVGNDSPVEVWSGTAAGTVYPISLSTQYFPKLNSKHEDNFDIYARAISSDKARIEIGNITAFTKEGQNFPISFKTFDYAKQADFSDAWQYLKTTDSVVISGVQSIKMNVSITTNAATPEDSLGTVAKPKESIVTPSALDIYNGEELISTTLLSENKSKINKEVEFIVPNGTLLGLKPVVRFKTKESSTPEIKFTTIENTISPVSLKSEQSNMVSALTPKDLNLFQNYPNPFNPTTMISYALPKATLVTIKVFDVLGKEVVTLFSGRQDAGTYNVPFNASLYSSGVYFYQLKTDNAVLTRKMIFTK